MNNIFLKCFVLMVAFSFNYTCYGSVTDTIVPNHKVTLPEAHVGNLEIDTKLLDSYKQLPDNIRKFYFDARAVFNASKDAEFTDAAIIEAARKNGIPLMGGPMLGNLSENGVIVWIRPAAAEPLLVKVSKPDGSDEKLFKKKYVEPGVEQRIVLDGLKPGTDYKYTIYAKKQKIAGGSFKTSPATKQTGKFRVAFGSCFHKIGLHNPNLINQILKREPGAMMLLGDIAVDDREGMINMHRSDYLLRDLSQPWRDLSANVPLYACWDDHDYFNNDLSGVPERFSETDRKAARAVWQQNWNNPVNEKEGIYFSTRTGPVELIMLDTRSLRTNEKRREYGSYLGAEQLNWLKQTLKKSTAPFKIISSGTMWSDYISNGKDSWGTWDTEAREEIFSFIEKENISGVLLISGDRHGARGFTIPRPSGFAFYEFEAATLGGVPGPVAMAKDTSSQLFGYIGKDLIAFGEFTFETSGDEPSVVFRLIDQFGKVMEEHSITYGKLTPGK